MRKEYFPIRGLRLEDEVWAELNRYKEKEETWNKAIKRLLNKETNLVKQEVQNVEIVKQSIHPILKAFYEINPTLNFANKTQRKACEDLVKQFGVDRVLKVVEFVGQVKGMPYCPVITTPIQLRDKWSALEIFALSEKNKKSSKNLSTSNPNL